MGAHRPYERSRNPEFTPDEADHTLVRLVSQMNATSDYFNRPLYKAARNVPAARTARQVRIRRDPTVAWRPVASSTNIVTARSAAARSSFMSATVHTAWSRTQHNGSP